MCSPTQDFNNLLQGAKPRPSESPKNVATVYWHDWKIQEMQTFFKPQKGNLYFKKKPSMFSTQLQLKNLRT